MLRGIFAFAVLVVATVILASSVVVVQPLVPRRNFATWIGALWSRIMLWAVGARVTYEGLEHSRSSLPCIFMSNHESNVDIWALAPVMPGATRWVAKQSLFRVPFLGLAMRAAGFIPIDRANRVRAVQSLSRAAERIRDGRPVLLFPEGTRSRDGSLQPFKKGPFHLAMKAGVPVVPVAILGARSVMPPRSIRVSPGPVRVRFLPPVDPTPYQPGDLNGLSIRVREAVREAREPGVP